MRKVLLFIITSFLFLDCYSQSTFSDYARLLEMGIQDNFYIKDSGYYRENAKGVKSDNPVSYLWSLCALVQAEYDYSLQHKSNHLTQVYNVIDKYYDTRLPAPGYASYSPILKQDDRYYDDNQWIGIAALDGYIKNKNLKLLEIGSTVYRFMVSGMDTVLGGGIYWVEERKESKNTCSNGPGILVALKMYSATNNKNYLDSAKLLYDWTMKTLQDKDFLFWDNIHTKDHKIDSQKYSYNVGTMLESSAYLFQITKEKKYLNAALNMAKASDSYFLKDGKFKDDYWFSAVLLRGLKRLYSINKNPIYINHFSDAVKNALKEDWDASRNIMGKNGNHNLVWQGGMLEMLCSLK
ncbi:glycoside hydrolase family 76 protein [Rhizosphaericola mali]|uniref:Glycoside hydrolase family 76 n=1 Tax=Rhizosphaericola mali TaxID=2545455 RepID=A0A5P2G6J6_9BACT|nr:glycoside hydrolase family 76 protein [Rhizosphaericola mali]QES87131.1 glycoside hydrolase family 76 [Rhizosphaericola mali]